MAKDDMISGRYEDIFKNARRKRMAKNQSFLSNLKSHYGFDLHSSSLVRLLRMEIDVVAAGVLNTIDYETMLEYCDGRSMSSR